MFGHLLIRSNGDQSLDAFVTTLPSLIGCERWEQRESSDYVEGRYYRSFVLGLEITVAIADDSEFADYDFELTLQPHGIVVDDKTFLAGIADNVARVLAVGGCEVLRPLDASRAGSGAILYRGNPLGTRLRERVVTEEI